MSILCDSPPARHHNDQADAEALFAANERLARFVAGKFRRQAHAAGVEFDDLAQACLTGLWRAAQCYDPSRGVRFGTYAHAACLSRALTLLRTARRQRSEWHLAADRPGPDGLDALNMAQARREADPAGDQAEARERLRPLLRALPARLRLVVELRYGLDGDGEHTLEDVGRVLGVCRERVRQLEHAAFKRLLAARRK